MLLGKRPRAPMKRTTSVAELPAPEADVETDQERQQQLQRERLRLAAAAEEMWMDARNAAAAAAAAPPRPSEFPVAEMTPFLTDCGLCRRRLATGRDIFMYRGEIAFCSIECRQKQMNLDERKEKCSVTSMKKDVPPVTPAGSSAPAAISL